MRTLFGLACLSVTGCPERPDPPVGFNTDACVEDADCALGLVCSPRDEDECTVACETDDDCPSVHGSQWCHYMCADSFCSPWTIDCGEPGRAESAWWSPE